MTQELIERLRAKAGQYDAYDWHALTELEAAAALERLTAENAMLKTVLAGVKQDETVLTAERDNLIAQRTAETTEFARLVDHCKAERVRAE